MYLASRMGREQRYADEAAAFGRLLAAEGIDLVYGGSRLGLMGVLADAVLANGGTAIGVIPRHLEGEEAHRTLSHLHVVEDMHRRKEQMAALAQAFVAVPGGFGTLDEIFEMLAGAQLDLHRKPCVFLNRDGYYDDLFRFLDGAVSRDLLTADSRALAQQAPTAGAVLAVIRKAWAARDAAAMRAAHEETVDTP